MKANEKSYERVLPRDLFNEAKLLKCYGQLSLAIHDGWEGSERLSLDYEATEFGEGFRVEQCPSDGSLFCLNLDLHLDGHGVCVFNPLNSRADWPMWFSDEELDRHGQVFSDDGKSFSLAFVSYLREVEAF